MLGVISAMPEECAALVAALSNPVKRFVHGRIYNIGYLNDYPVVVVFCRWGKVAAATTATQLFSQFGVDKILFTGVAGAIDPSLKVGDIVVGRRTIQHDMDASPLFPRYEIPLLDRAYFDTTDDIREKLVVAANSFLSNDLTMLVSEEVRKMFCIEVPLVYQGDIASGDKFIAEHRDRDNLRSRLPTSMCVEMEGAAVAQVCFEYEAPFGIVRTISDNANESAPTDFSNFIKHVAPHYSLGIIKRFLAPR